MTKLVSKFLTVYDRMTLIFWGYYYENVYTGPYFSDASNIKQRAYKMDKQKYKQYHATICPHWTNKQKTKTQRKRVVCKATCVALVSRLDTRIYSKNGWLS